MARSYFLLALFLVIVGCSGERSIVGTWEGRDEAGDLTRMTFHGDGTWESTTNQREGASKGRPYFFSKGKWRSAGDRYEVAMDQMVSIPEHPFQAHWQDMKGVFVGVPIKWLSDDSFEELDEEEPIVFVRKG